MPPFAAMARRGLQSASIPADAPGRMPLTADQFAGLAIAAIAVACVVFCLKVIGNELEKAVRRRRLHDESARLRDEQARRLRELANGDAGSRRRRGQPAHAAFVPDVDILDEMPHRPASAA